ncbi:hypothetical protein C943_01624 [Mariniradius saccharolyticus AK6]|uniref:Uncharacterized protein n=1 Tax=Mariniradius saccharolyticus AK6 TaxID=1239962 RepID=M7XAX9_9BACT|nr:hypothetical protein C943_01624 [Mariniradius saccharolyticus AK6]
MRSGFFSCCQNDHGTGFKLFKNQFEQENHAMNCFNGTIERL